MIIDKATENISKLQNIEDQVYVLFDLGVGGHHASYISYLIEYWCSEKILGKLIFVVSPKFLKQHSSVVELRSSAVDFISISEEENTLLEKQNRTISIAFTEWSLYCKYAALMKANHGFLMYFDHLQLPIILGKKSPCTFSGIYFRPVFHYQNFEGFESNFKSFIHGLRQKIILSLALREKKLTSLLSLDSYAVPYIRKLTKLPKNIFHIQDPVAYSNVDLKSSTAFKQKLKIEENRKVFLLFGYINERKGIHELLDALSSLKEKTSKRICLLLVGKISDDIESKVLNKVRELVEKTNLQIIVENKYQREQKIPLYFSVSDVILAPYRKHVGMSGIVNWGITYNKVILGSNYGLMGKIIREYSLGYSLSDNTSVVIKENIEALLKKSKIANSQASEHDVGMEKISLDKFSRMVFDTF